MEQYGSNFYIRGDERPPLLEACETDRRARPFPLNRSHIGQLYVYAPKITAKPRIKPFEEPFYLQYLVTMGVTNETITAGDGKTFPKQACAINAHCKGAEYLIA